MATQSNTFERKEKKYLLTAQQCVAIKRGLAAHMQIDDYGLTRVDSLYLDTPNRSLIARSLEKPLYKEKLRVRSYEAFSQATFVFVELKKKYEGIVYKRRVRMSKKAAQAYISGVPYEEAVSRFPLSITGDTESMLPGTVQIARELDAFFHRYQALAPSMVISCQREAWKKIDELDENCVDRVTFDHDISYIDLYQSSAAVRLPVTGEGQVVMEVKCAGGYPPWLCELFSSVGAYPRSFSKYGNAYKRCLANQGHVTVSPRDSGKVSIQSIPRSNRRRTTTGEVLIAPSAGYEM